MIKPTADLTLSMLEVIGRHEEMNSDQLWTDDEQQCFLPIEEECNRPHNQQQDMLEDHLPELFGAVGQSF